MANAKRCDVCGEYYDVPEIDEDHYFNTNLNTSMIRVLRLKSPNDRITHETMQFDACESCLQNVLDYILSRQAEWESKSEVTNG